jgi:type II secretory pathway predicted ATPase ExeA
MYLEHFHLKELPFRLSPDPAFLYLSQIHSRAKAYMESTIWFTDGFVVITGEIGSGKTTLIETVWRSCANAASRAVSHSVLVRRGMPPV